MRKSIHDILSESCNIRYDLIKLYDIFTRPEITNIAPYSLYGLANIYFYKWPYSGTCLSLDEYIDIVGLYNSDNINNADSHQITDIVFHNLEFYINMMDLIDIIVLEKFGKHSLFSGVIKNQRIKIFVQIIDNLLEVISAKKIEIEPHKFIVVANNEEAVAVAEISKNNQISIEVLRYNHFKVKGDISAKRNILIALAHDFEKDRKKSNNKAGEDFFFIVNKSNIRHNHEKNPDSHITTNMSDDEIEEVYDLAYRLYLTAKLNHEYNNIMSEQVSKYKSLI